MDKRGKNIEWKEERRRCKSFAAKSINEEIRKQNATVKRSKRENYLIDFPEQQIKFQRGSKLVMKS